MVQRIKKSTQRKKSHFFLYFFIVLIIGAAVILGLLFLKPALENQNQGSDNSQATTQDSTSSSDQTSSDSSKTSETKSDTIERESEKNNPQYEGEDPNTLESLTGAISFAGVSDGNFMVNVVIDQAIGTSGRCNYTLTHSSGVVLVGDVSTEAGPSSSVCVYSIPTTNVQSGNWKITVKVTADNKEGTISGEANV